LISVCPILQPQSHSVHDHKPKRYTHLILVSPHTQMSKLLRHLSLYHFQKSWQTRWIRKGYSFFSITLTYRKKILWHFLSYSILKLIVFYISKWTIPAFIGVFCMYNSWFVCWDANNEQYKFQVDLQKCYNNLILTPPFFIYISKIEKKSKKAFLINSVNSNNFVYFFHFHLILCVKLSFKKWKI
jgi:hypothetical protein